MGRYYQGDIEGKFWFAVQSSDAPSRFSKSAECERSYIEYCFDDEHLQDVQKELRKIKKKIGDRMEKFDEFFSREVGYNDEMLKAAGLPIHMVSVYADYKLGKQIEECIINTGQCSFNAEI